MNKSFFICFFLLMLSVGYMYSQNYKSGFILEIAGLSTSTSSFENLDDEKEFVTGYGVSYSGKYRLTPLINWNFDRVYFSHRSIIMAFNLVSF